MLNLKNVLNTTESTIIMSKGFRTDHRTPRALRRYFSLKSLDTRDVMVNQFLLALALESIFGINAVPYRLVVAQGQGRAGRFATLGPRACDQNYHDVLLYKVLECGCQAARDLRKRTETFRQTKPKTIYTVAGLPNDL